MTVKGRNKEELDQETKKAVNKGIGLPFFRNREKTWGRRDFFLFPQNFI
jgi:hypothetical protein